MTLDMTRLKGQVEGMAAELAGDGKIQLAEIVPSRWQPRSPLFDGEELWELAKSIEEIGLIHPIIVFFNEDGHYELVAGERRTRAMTALALAEEFDNHTPKDYVLRLANVGLNSLNQRERSALIKSGATIPARVEEAGSDDARQRLHRVAVMENIERSNLSPLEEARGLASLMEEYGWSQREIARRVGKSQGYVAQRVALLALPETAQEAVNTRVLNTTHARALQSVPEKAADQVAEQVIKDVRSGATTREINLFTNWVKRFLDPATYELDEDRVYLPKERNRRRLMQWVLENYDPDIKKLKGSTVLNSMIEAVVGYRMDRAMAVFGLEDVDAAWRVFAEDTGRQCQRCQWRYKNRQWICGVGDPPCKLMKAPNATTCQRFIGENEPTIVRVQYDLRYRFEDLEIDILERDRDKLKYAEYESIDDFLLDYDRALALQDARIEEKEEEKNLGYLDDIAEFQAWQESLDDEWLNRFRAHSCEKCAHYRPGQFPACQYGAQPLFKEDQDKPRAPYFYVWVGYDGAILPRCERFTYPRSDVVLEIVARTRGTQVSLQERDRVLSWFQTLGDARFDDGFWAPLQWLNYGRLRPNEADKKPDCVALAEYLEAQWLMPGLHFDEIVIRLLDTLLSEDNAMIDRKHKIIRVLNPVSGEWEEYVTVPWYYANGEYDWPTWIEWPEDWPANPFKD